MKMANRHLVEGTIPAINIGQRQFRDRNGVLKSSSMWHAEYWLDGRQRTKSLQTSNKAAAIKKAYALCQQIEEGREEKPRKRVTVDVLVEEYLSMQGNQGRAPKTIEKYKFVLQTFADWAKKNDCELATTFKERHFWAYRKSMADAGKSPKTQADRLILVKQLFKWAAGRGRLLHFNPVAHATVNEPDATPQPCFTPEQVNALLQGADAHYAPIFAIMAYAGLRFGEVRDLRWQDLLLDRGKYGMIRVQLGGSSGTTTKGGQTRYIPIHPRLREYLDAVPRDGERVFNSQASKRWGNRKQTKLNERTVIQALKHLCAKLNFENAEIYKLHTFRHAFASMCARNNTSYKYALQFMGHKSSEILDLYYTMYDSTAEAAIGTINYASVEADTDGKSNAA